MTDTESTVIAPFKDQLFTSKQDWINRASLLLTSHPKYNNTTHGEESGYRGEHFTAMCFDQLGRRCTKGEHFMRAEDDKTYPIWWVWPDQIPALVIPQVERIK